MGFWLVRAGLFKPQKFAGFRDRSDHRKVWFRFLGEHLRHAGKSKDKVLGSDDDVDDNS